MTMNTRNIWKNTKAVGKLTVIIAAVLGVCGLGGIAAWMQGGSTTTSLTTPTPQPTGTATTFNITLTTNQIGLSKLIYANGANPINIYPIEMPVTFNYTQGSLLNLTAIPIAGYRLNTYYFMHNGTFQSPNIENSLVFRGTENLQIEVRMELNDTAPS